MKALESWAVVYLLNSIWQIPLVFLAASVAARLVRPTGPRMEHRVWAIALIAEAILPICNFQLGNFHPDSLWQQIWALITSILGKSAGIGHIRVIIGASTVAGTGPLRFPAQLLTAIITAYVCTLLYFTGRLAWGLYRTDQMLREAQPLQQSSLSSNVTEALARKLARLSHLSTSAPVTSAPVQIAISPMISSPVTIGIRQRILLMPPGFLENVSDPDLDAVLAHEFAHIRRRDFAKNLLYGFLSLPAAYHPVLWLTNSRLCETREMVCDEIAAEAVTGRESYARALLRLASMLSDRTPARTLHAIGIFDANIFERRVMNLTQKRKEIPAPQRFAMMAICAVVACIACVSALSLRMDVSPVAAAQSTPPKKIHVDENNLHALTRVNPVYPPEAKKAGIQGSVILGVLISKEGVPEHVSIQSGPRELQESALTAVRQWRWEPYHLNGEPIEVETSITVVYSLAG